MSTQISQNKEAFDNFVDQGVILDLPITDMSVSIDRQDLQEVTITYVLTEEAQDKIKMFNQLDTI